VVAHCDVRLLGGFGVVVDGQPISVNSWRSRRAADLVKLLAIESTHQLHREQVMAALWPDLPIDAAAMNLRKAVHYARRALGSAGAVGLTTGLLTLWPGDGLDVDLDRFHRAATQALASGDPAICARTAALFVREVLPGDRYEEWAAEARARSRSAYVALLRAAGDWHRLLELDETDEVAHRALMRIHLDADERREAILAEAERLAREARALALDACLGHELGEASTLLALVAYARDTWRDLFRAEFADSVRQEPRLENAVYDAHLCYQEFYLHGTEGHAGAGDFAQELLEIASSAGSSSGRALATLLMGEFDLLSGRLDSAAAVLRQAAEVAEEAGCVSAHSIALERLAEAQAARGDRASARELLPKARSLAESSGIPSHLVVRVFGVALLATQSVVDAMRVVREAEHWLADAPRVCEPCSMTFRVEAARVSARAGDLARARRHVAEADRITGLWQGGPWIAATWEARAELRRASGQGTQASALFLEAAESFAELRRPLDESRCRAEAALVTR
jgi:DNA-binding SARP family transcriptional activator